MAQDIYVLTDCNEDCLDDVDNLLDMYSLHNSLEEAQQEAQDICCEDTSLEWTHDSDTVWNATYGNLFFRIRKQQV